MYIKNFNTFCENIVYHGKKNDNTIDMENIGKSSVYFYLTPNYEYALEYSNKNRDNVYKFELDESKLLDLRTLGVKKYKFSELRIKFNKLTNLFWPLELQQKRSEDTSLWEWIRYDTNGVIKKTIEKAVT